MAYKKRKIFQTFDPLDREVYLTEGTWDKCQLNHQEIKSYTEIKNAIEVPNYISEDKNKSTTYNYYKENDIISTEYEKYTKVCVNFEENPKKGKVSTAFKCKKIHHSDDIKWKN